MTASQTESSSAPEAIENQPDSGGPSRTVSLIWDVPAHLRSQRPVDQIMELEDCERLGVVGVAEEDELVDEHREEVGQGARASRSDVAMLLALDDDARKDRHGLVEAGTGIRVELGKNWPGDGAAAAYVSE
jgi:hypothetical protein